MCAIDITAEQRKTVLALLARHLPNTTAWVYGSRVKWTSSPKSDLDLVVFATPEQAGRVSDLREAFEESNLPFRVDLFVWDTVPQQFRKAIEAERVVLVGKGGNGKWRSCNWGDLATLEYGKALRGYRSAEGPYRVFGTNGPIGRHTEMLYDGPSVIVGRKGAYRGIHYAPDPFFVIDTAFYLKPKAQFDVRWAYYELLAHDINGLDSGSAIPSTDREAFYGLPVRVPPLSEQRAIAHILGTLDDKIELNRRMNETLEAMARALFKSWFVDFDPVHAKATLKTRAGTLPQGVGDWSVERANAYLDRMDPNVAALFPDRFVDSELGPIPEGWEVKPMGKLCNKPQYGYTASAKNEAVGPKFLRITDINKKAWIEWESIPYCEIIGQDFDKYRLYEGDILIARMADPGHGCMIEEKQQAVFASYLIRFRPLQKRYARLLQYWLRSDAYWELVRERGGGTTRVSLNAKVLSEFSLTVPTCHLIDAFAKQVDSLRVGVVANSIESRALTDLRDTLLPKLLSGKVRVSGGTENSGR